MPTSAPWIANTVMIVRSREMPETRAASAFPPTAQIARPVAV